MENTQAPPVLLLQAYNWEGLYINGILVDQGSKLSHDEDRLYLLKKADQYGFNADDVLIIPATEDDKINICGCGKFPGFQEELQGDYE